jgi:hypothetical protein
MRVRTALALLIAVNVLWAAAFLGYVQRSTPPVRKLAEEATAAPVAPATNLPGTNIAPTVMVVTNVAVPPVATNSAPREPKSLVSNGKKFGWQDVTNETYIDYVLRLRAVGCPDNQIRTIVLADVNGLIDQRRLEQAIKTDSQWWKPETFMGVLPMQNAAGADLDSQRRELLTKILGEDEADAIKTPSLNTGAVNLSGPVLGALPLETWNAVQEVCARSMERHQAHQMARINDGGAAVDNVELAKLRHQTRTELAKILNAEQLEEFLLRYSHNSSRLRNDLRGIDVTPDEFRRLFRAIDPLEHQTQIDYGGIDALSTKQREQIEAQWDRAAREVLAPERLALYLATKDPLYKQAQLMATQYGLNGKAVQALHEMQKGLDAKRAQIARNAGMTPEQKNEALQAVGLEHQQALQRILANTGFRQ